MSNTANNGDNRASLTTSVAVDLSVSRVEGGNGLVGKGKH